MADVSSGEFVYYNPGGGAVDEIGLVLRTSSNKKADDTTDEYVELLGPFPKHLLTADCVRPFNEPPKKDETEVVSSDTSEVTGVGQPSPAARGKAGTK